VGFQRFRHMSGDRAGRITTDALFQVCAELAPFEPRFETCARRLLPLSAAYDLALSRNPITERFLARAAAADRRTRPMNQADPRSGS
jgi:hypothetical protein